MEIESRQWGMYEVLLDAPECKVKRITVAPGQRYHISTITNVKNNGL